MDAISYVQIDNTGIRFSWLTILIIGVIIGTFVYYYYKNTDESVDPVPADKIDATNIEKNNVVLN